MTSVVSGAMKQKGFDLPIWSDTMELFNDKIINLTTFV